MGRPIKIRPVETRAVKDKVTGKVIGRKPRKPTKPSKPQKPEKSWKIKKQIYIYDGSAQSFAEILKELPEGVDLEKVYIITESYGYDGFETYVEYDGIFEQSDAEYKFALQQHKKKLRNYENRLKEWTLRMEEYDQLLPGWLEVEAAHEVRVLQRELEKAEEALAKRLKRKYVLPEETKVRELKDKLAKVKASK